MEHYSLFFIPDYEVGRGYCPFPYASFAEKEAQLVGDRSLSFSRALTVEAFWTYGRLATAP